MEVETEAPVRTVVESIVHRPTETSQRKRKTPPSPVRSQPSHGPRPRTLLSSNVHDRGLQRIPEPESRVHPAEKEADKEEKPVFDPKAEYERLLNARSGGVYVPPARLRALQAQFTDKNTKEYQRMAWEALKKSINGLINKVLFP